MATNTINQNVNTAITDFGLIKQAIVNKGVSVPTGTPTSQYGNKISSIQTGADVSGVTATAGDVDTGKVFVNSSGAEVTGTSTYKSDYTALNTLVGQTTAAAEDVAQGKVFVNSNGVQTTGTASGGNEDLVKMIERPENCTITIPNGTTEIGTSAFQNFRNLISVNLPTTLTTIGANAFYNCLNLVLSSLPPNISEIKGAAFYTCGSIRQLTFLGTPTSIESTVFNNCTNLTTIRVPWASGAVANSPWGATNASVIYNYTP